MNHKKYLFSVVFLIVFSAMLTSCTLPQYVYIYNNTVNNIQVTFVIGDKKEVHSVDPKTMQSYKIGMYSPYNVLKVSSNKDTWSYRYEEPNSRFWSYEGVGPLKKIAIKLQVESDGKIYILPRDGDFPLKSGSDQPNGYPLTPL